MRSKAPLVMMEMLVMLLVFALAAGLCVKAFVWSRNETEANFRMDRAVLAAENTAQIIKSAAGDFEEAAGLLSGDSDGDTLTYTIELENGNLEITAEIIKMDQYLGTAEIVVLDQGKEVFALETSWQEVSSFE